MLFAPNYLSNVMSNDFSLFLIEKFKIIIFHIREKKLKQVIDTWT